MGIKPIKWKVISALSLLLNFLWRIIQLFPRNDKFLTIIFSNRICLVFFFFIYFFILTFLKFNAWKILGCCGKNLGIWGLEEFCSLHLWNAIQNIVLLRFCTVGLPKMLFASWMHHRSINVWQQFPKELVNWQIPYFQKSIFSRHFT